MLANVDRRFPMTDAVKIARLLDPSSKNKNYVEMSFSEKQDLLLSAARDDGNSNSSYSVSNMSESSDVGGDTEALLATSNQSKRLKLMDEFDDDEGESDSDLTADVIQYLSPAEIPTTTEEKGNPLINWIASSVLF